MRIIGFIAVLFAIPLFSTCQTVQKPDDASGGKPFTIGTVRQIHSNILGQDRVLNIYLPADFKQDDTTHYAVIYLLDGSSDEDFIHVSGLVQYNTLPWINLLPPTIVVGIANIDRKHDFTYPSDIDDYKKIIPTGGGSEKFIRFLETELRPWVDTHYKTSKTRILIGQSLGGLLATEILLKKPQLFTHYMIISPSLWWDDGSLFNIHPDVLNSNYNKPANIYIGVGNESPGLGSRPHIMQDDARHLADTLKNTSSPTVKVFFDYLPDETHATITHNAVFHAIRMLFPPRK